MSASQFIELFNEALYDSSGCIYFNLDEEDIDNFNKNHDINLLLVNYQDQNDVLFETFRYIRAKHEALFIQHILMYAIRNQIEREKKEKIEVIGEAERMQDRTQRQIEELADCDEEKDF